jgi:hypothetical protein
MNLASLHQSLLAVGLTALASFKVAACSREEPDGSSQRALGAAQSQAKVEKTAFKSAEACRQCERADPGCASLIDVCSTLEGSANEGPQAGRPRKELCQAVMACVERTDCAKSHVSGCYCGSAQSTECLDGKANGACKAEMEAALESLDPMVVARRYDEEAFAGSVAMWRYHCLHRQCEEQCF